ncbi:MAG: cell wall hydrolase [Nitrospirales bacterium]
MNTPTTNPRHNHQTTDQNADEEMTDFSDPVFLDTKKRIIPIGYYSTLVCMMGLSCILIPLNPGNDQLAHQTLAVASQISTEMPTNHHSSPSFQKEPPRHDDDALAALTIYFEAKGESFAGKLAVAAVIRNRMAHRFHSDGTVRGTVLRPKQFEPWITRNPDTIPFNPSNTKMQESLLAWKLVQDGREIVNGAVLFYNPEIVKSPRWAKVHRKVAKIGGHEFFHTERI